MRIAGLLSLAGGAVLTLAPAAAAVPGDLDPAFSSDGKVTTDVTSGVDIGVGVAIQGDGKIVVAGEVAGGGGRLGLTRYNEDGSLDTSFSADGKLTTNFTSGDDVASDVVIQPDGKIVAAGRAGGSGGQFAVARYNADGTLDSSFSGDGKQTTNFTSGNDWAFGLALQADGKIVAVGRAAGAGGRFAVVRYNADGTLDAGFSSDGKVATDFTSGFDIADHVAIQPADEKIVAVGTADYMRSTARFALARYNTDGTLDPAFAGDGKVTTNFTSGFDGGFAGAVQIGDGKIVAVGQAGSRMGVARYNTNGTLDASFSADGKVATNFTVGSDYADDVVIQADGKIVGVGAANYFGSNANFALARYNANGSLDATFSSDGKQTTSFTSRRDLGYGAAIDGAGKVVVAGGSGIGGSNPKFAVARYLAD